MAIEPNPAALAPEVLQVAYIEAMTGGLVEAYAFKLGDSGPLLYAASCGFSDRPGRPGERFVFQRADSVMQALNGLAFLLVKHGRWTAYDERF
jgi:hypothetical protein